jgi:Kef-type K+ transport system membrane component KefB
VNVLAELFVILIIVRALGELAGRAGLPASVGEISAGILVAALAGWYGRHIPFLSQLASSEVLEIVAQLGIFVLVLSAGVEMQPQEIKESSAASFVVAVGGLVVPLAGGFALAWVFLPESGMRPVQALLTGVALSISAIPATVKVLTDLGVLHSRVGEIIVSAAVFDDVLGLFLLAVLLAMIDTGHPPDMGSLVWLLAKVVIFFAVTIALGVHVYPRVRRGLRAIQVAAIELSALGAVAIAYGWLAEALGMHWVLGAFMAGLFFEPVHVGAKAYSEIRLICGAVASGFLGPLFFAYIGLRVDLSAITTVPGFLCLIVLVAFFGKVFGAGIPAYCLGMERREALSVGVGMSARGAVELVILSIAYEAGVFAVVGPGNSIAHHLYSSLILVGVVTTLAVPLLLPHTLPKAKSR